jgi:hypothetical protein
VSDAFSAPGGDAFAAKLNAAGTALVYFSYLGGAQGDGRERTAPLRHHALTLDRVETRESARPTPERE